MPNARELLVQLKLEGEAEVKAGLKGVETAGVQGMGQVAGAAQKADAEIKKVDVSTRQLGGALTSLGSNISRYVSIPLAALGTIAVKTTLDFINSEDAIAKLSESGRENLTALRETFEELKSATEAERIALAEGMIPVINDLTQNYLIPAIEKLQEMTDAFFAQPEAVKQAELGIAAFLAVLGPGVYLIGSFCRAIADIGIAIKALNVVLATPAGLLVAGLAIGGGAAAYGLSSRLRQNETERQIATGELSFSVVPPAQNAGGFTTPFDNIWQVGGRDVDMMAIYHQLNPPANNYGGGGGGGSAPILEPEIIMVEYELENFANIIRDGARTTETIFTDLAIKYRGTALQGTGIDPIFRGSFDMRAPKGKMSQKEIAQSMGYSNLNDFLGRKGGGGGFMQSDTAGYLAALGQGALQGGGGGFASAAGSVASMALFPALGPFAGLAGGLVEGLFGKLFGKKKKPEYETVEPIPVKVVNWADFEAVMLKITSSGLVAGTTAAIDRIASNLRSREIATGTQII